MNGTAFSATDISDGGNYDSSQWLDSFETVHSKELFTSQSAGYIVTPVDGGKVSFTVKPQESSRWSEKLQ